MRDLDAILYDALSPMREPDDAVNRKIVQQVGEKQKKQKSGGHEVVRNVGKWRRRSLQTAAAAAVSVVALSSLTAYAAWRYLAPNEIAQEIEDTRLAEEFKQNNRLEHGETQSYGGYDITLLGIVSGKEISDFSEHARENVEDDKTYVAVAIARADGTPMPDGQDEAYDSTEIFVSPYIKGLNPMDYNAYFLDGGFSSFVKDGVQYRILETDNVEVFADRGIYIGVSDGMTYNNQAFVYNAESGELVRNTEYQGLNALFVLPIDASKADAEEAAAILDRVEQRANGVETQEEQEEHGVFSKEVEEFMAKLTVENIDIYAEPVESTRQTVTPDENNYFSYSYKMPDESAGSGTFRMDFIFQEGKIGMSDMFNYSASDGKLEYLQIQTFTLNEDGTVTSVVYVPRKAE